MAFDFTTITPPFRMQPGLRRLAAGSQQLTPNRLDATALREKLAVLGQHAGQALLCASGFDAVPAVLALAQHAATEQPEALAWDGARRFEARHLGWSVLDGQPVGDGPEAIGACLTALPAPWRVAALLALAFAEDFAVIDGSTGHIPWLAVCLPSHWVPADKVGRHFAQVHAPVADNQLLLTASDHLARLVTGRDRWERFVWTITSHPHLDANPQRAERVPWPVSASADQLVQQAYFRTERQTFIPLPQHRQAIFTIHVEVAPLTQAVAQAEQAQRLHDAVSSMSPNVLAYRSLTGARDRLVSWLSSRALQSDS